MDKKFPNIISTIGSAFIFYKWLSFCKISILEMIFYNLFVIISFQSLLFYFSYEITFKIIIEEIFLFWMTMFCIFVFEFLGMFLIKKILNYINHLIDLYIFITNF